MGNSAYWGMRHLVSQTLGLLFLCTCSSLTSCSSYKSSAECYSGPPASLYGSSAGAPVKAPAIVHQAMQAGNRIQNAPYQYGGGHGAPCWGLDCSGSVSYVLRSCGLLQDAMPSKGFRNYGESGPGKWITIFSRDGHVFMTIAGLRLDTSSSGGSDVGPRWTRKPRSIKGFRVRHPSGL